MSTRKPPKPPSENEGTGNETSCFGWGLAPFLRKIFARTPEVEGNEKREGKVERKRRVTLVANDVPRDIEACGEQSVDEVLKAEVGGSSHRGRNGTGSGSATLGVIPLADNDAGGAQWGVAPHLSNQEGQGVNHLLSIEAACER